MQDSNTTPTSGQYSIVANVLKDIATGNLRFALIGTADGGVEIWRAATQPPQNPKPSHSIAPEPEPLVCDSKTARKLLGGMSTTSLWYLEKRGIIKRLPDFPKARYSVAHLKAVVTSQTNKKTTQWTPPPIKNSPFTKASAKRAAKP